MANMSYCRFRNTLIDVEDCLEALGNRDIPLAEERTAAGSLLETVLRFCYDEGIIYPRHDEEHVLKIISECEERTEEEE